MPESPHARSHFATVFKTVMSRISLSALLALQGWAWGQVAVPDTPAGRTLGALLEAFNSGDRATVEAYYRIYEPSVSADSIMPLLMKSGGFDLVEIRKGERLRVEFLVKERASDTRAIGKVEVKDADPAPVTSFVLRGIPRGASQPGFDIDAATRARVLDGAIAELHEWYVFPEVAKQMEQALRARQKHGDYDAVTDGDSFANMLTLHFQEVSHDKHLRVTFSPFHLSADAPKPDQPPASRYRNDMRVANCGFEKVERLAGNIGYLKFNFFADPEVCGATAVAAMNFLGNVDALIVDMRENGGGDPKMIALVSTYLFAKRTHLNDLWERKGDTTEQYWTLPFVPGDRLGSQPVYVLISKRTFSGAEEFSYNLKSLKRATLVGETTGGGAHPVRGQRIDDRFSIGVPFARAINPITRTNWEGTGVEPDVKVAATDALATAQKLAMEEMASKQKQAGQVH